MSFSRILPPATTFLVLTLPLACIDSSRAEQRFPTRTNAPPAVARTGADPTLTGAGDIASCASSGDERTARLLDDIPGPIFTVGDNAYRSEEVENPLAECYETSWGRHRARTRPVPGNHDYEDGEIDTYFAYFGRPAGADVVVNGHDHIYERFGPMTDGGDRDNRKGMREFIVGTGGDSHYDIENVAAHSEVRNDDTYGVLSLTLHSGSYDWRFVPVHGRTFSDSGTGSCH